MELLQGFISILNPVTMLLIIGGVLGGLVIGALPGLSAFTALAIMLPFTFGMEPVNGISFLMAVYVGGCSGGLWLFLQLYFVLGRWITIRGFPAIPYHQPQVDDRSLWFHIIPHPPGG